MVHPGCEQRDQRRLIDIPPIGVLTADDEVELIAEVAVAIPDGQVPGDRSAGEDKSRMVAE